MKHEDMFYIPGPAASFAARPAPAPRLEGWEAPVPLCTWCVEDNCYEDRAVVHVLLARIPGGDVEATRAASALLCADCEMELAAQWQFAAVHPLGMECVRGEWRDGCCVALEAKPDADERMTDGENGIDTGRIEG